MTMTLMPTEPDHSPYTPLINEARNEHPDVLPSELVIAPPWPRSMLLTLNVILLVLVSILIILGVNALKDETTDLERRERFEYCQLFKDDDPNRPDDCPPYVPSVEEILNGD